VGRTAPPGTALHPLHASREQGGALPAPPAQRSLGLASTRPPPPPRARARSQRGGAAPTDHAAPFLSTPLRAPLPHRSPGPPACLQVGVSAFLSGSARLFGTRSARGHSIHTLSLQVVYMSFGQSLDRHCSSSNMLHLQARPAPLFTFLPPLPPPLPPLPPAHPSAPPTPQRQRGMTPQRAAASFGSRRAPRRGCAQTFPGRTRGEAAARAPQSIVETFARLEKARPAEPPPCPPPVQIGRTCLPAPYEPDAHLSPLRTNRTHMSPRPRGARQRLRFRCSVQTMRTGAAGAGGAAADVRGGGGGGRWGVGRATGSGCMYSTSTGASRPLLPVRTVARAVARTVLGTVLRNVLGTVLGIVLGTVLRAFFIARRV